MLIGSYFPMQEILTIDLEILN